MGCSNEDKWNLNLIQRFFSEVEPKGPVKGRLTISKLNQYVQNLVSYNDSISETDNLPGRHTLQESVLESGTDDNYESPFFSRRKLVADEKLIKKVSFITITYLYHKLHFFC
jgi:hypothetical protein